jgi:glycosyltransferase involved in cell wall biosynthesis
MQPAGNAAVEASSPLATILVPTHSHASCLPHSVGSALRQTVGDFELLLVGDGVTAETRTASRALVASDPRIRFLDWPKGERKGEYHRHAALQEARGQIVAYLGDDDIWFPDHLEHQLRSLRHADFANTLHLGLGRDGAPFFTGGSLLVPAMRRRMLRERYNLFDMTFGAHTLAAYRRLARGWEPPPPEFGASDLHLWRSFLSEPWCRATTALIPTGICTQTHLRPHLSDVERAAELARLAELSQQPAWVERLRRSVGCRLVARLFFPRANRLPAFG